VVEAVREEVGQHLASLAKATQYNLFDDSASGEIEARVKKIRSRLARLPQSPDNADALTDFSPSQRQMLKSVIDTIHLNEERSDVADKLVRAILKRLRLQRK